jgi:putative FmdB family regulatory protein
MPTYEYRCKKCGDFEVVQKISDASLKACPTCGEPIIKLLSAAPFHLKGSGWYKTDYANGRSSGSNGSGPKPKDTKAENSGDKTEKPAETSSSSSSSSDSGDSSD